MSKQIKRIDKESVYKFKNIKQQFKNINDEFCVMAGPCAVENEEMLDIIANKLSKLGIKFLRGGTYKHRTSPYSFQGLGLEGVKILSKISKKYKMLSVSEVLDIRCVEKMIEYIDILQVGSRNMYNFDLLKEIGKTKHPVLLKRGMSATIEEFKCAAEYIACEGNEKIIMCERGIRTFEKETRNTLDISCVSILKRETKIPVIVDLSHSLGRKDIVIDIAKAVVALGADGVMVEVHCAPERSLSDKEQQLNLKEFERLIREINKQIEISKQVREQR